MKQQLYYKKGGEVKALFEGEDKMLYINDGDGNMIPYDESLEVMIKEIEEQREIYNLDIDKLSEIIYPKPTTSVSSPSDDTCVKLNFNHVNNHSTMEVAARVEAREPVKLSHLTREGQLLFKESGKNSFCHTVWRGEKYVWVWTGHEDAVK